jgi:hypothetical protein
MQFQVFFLKTFKILTSKIVIRFFYYIITSPLYNSII